MNEMTLFSQANSNKINSFHSRDVQRKRYTQKERVLDAIKHLGIASDREISDFTGIARHLIPDRRLSLMKAGLMKEASTKTDPVTGKDVSYYTTTNKVW